MKDFKHDFLSFFKNKYLKVFSYICILICVASVIISSISVYEAKKGIEEKISQKVQEINFEHDEIQKQESGNLAKSINESKRYCSDGYFNAGCRNNSANYIIERMECVSNKYCAQLIGENYKEHPIRYSDDKEYSKLLEIKNTPSIYLLVMRLNFGWLGLLGLLLVILLGVVSAISNVIKNNSVEIINTIKTHLNRIKNMNTFQHYSLVMLAIGLVILLFILIKL